MPDYKKILKTAREKNGMLHTDVTCYVMLQNVIQIPIDFSYQKHWVLVFKVVGRIN